jgi:hypothetical protein
VLEIDARRIAVVTRTGARLYRPADGGVLAWDMHRP